MPALFSLAIQLALHRVQGLLRDGEAIFAFLGVQRGHVGPRTSAAQRGQNTLLERRWRRAPAARHLPVPRRRRLGWRLALPADHQGLTVLGAPLGSPTPSQARVPGPPAPGHSVCRRPAGRVLLLHFCASPRANYLLRVLPPHLTQAFAADHDAAIARCLSALLDCHDEPLPPQSLRAAQLALRFGGLGLRSAEADRHAAHWASWCDTLPVIHARAPTVAGRLLHALQGDVPLPCAAAAADGSVVPPGPVMSARASRILLT